MTSPAQKGPLEVGRLFGPSGRADRVPQQSTAEQRLQLRALHAAASRITREEHLQRVRVDHLIGAAKDVQVSRCDGMRDALAIIDGVIAEVRRGELGT